MANLSAKEVGKLAYDAGIKSTGGLTHAIAIAKAESNFNPDAVGDVALQNDKWGPSLGLWQIRSLKAESGKGTERDGTRLKDPAFNAKSMASISKNGTDFGPWSTNTITTQATRFLYTATAVEIVATGGGSGGVASAIDTATGAADATAQAASDVTTAIRAMYNWISNRANWIRTVQVIAGAGLLLGGLYIVSRPLAEKTVAPVMKAAKGM